MKGVNSPCVVKTSYLCERSTPYEQSLEESVGLTFYWHSYGEIQ